MNKCLYILGVLMIGSASAFAGQRPTTMPSGDRVIVQIVSRDTTIVARSGDGGTVYSLVDKAGKVIVPSMTLPQMQAKHPELARHIRSMNASSRDTGAWAGVE